MNIRVFAVLFTAIFLVGSVPMLLVQPSGSASAGLAAGFVLPIENIYQAAALVAVGLLAAWFGREAIILLPLCALLMLSIGAMIQVDDHLSHVVRDFVLGAVLLFALSVSMLRNKLHVLSVPPIAIWVYFTGYGYMVHVPSITTPFYFLLGILISAMLMMAIGVSLGVTLTEAIQDSMEKLRTMPAISTFLSLF